MSRDAPGLFGSQAKPGLAAVGLFDSRTRPGMRNSFGSLSGSSLGDMPVSPVGTNPPSAQAVTPQPLIPGTGSNALLYAGIGVAALGAWWFFFHKK